MSRLFGTDGVRGRAGSPPLDRETIRRIGAALVRSLHSTPASPRLLIGRDTRESGPWIERELAHGARSAGAVVESAGVIPTPAIAYLTKALGYAAGVVISASHNPFEDNGIKVFSGAGEKFSEEIEQTVERLVSSEALSIPEGEAEPVGAVDLVDAYVDHLRLALPEPARLAGAPIAIDCGHGATVRVAPRLFEQLGLRVTAIGCEPNGRNINLECGSTHPEALATLVQTGGHRMGVAFDGDGDRAILVDHRGRLVDGDAVMLMCARNLKEAGRLRHNAIVSTVMSNIGLEIALKDHGIALYRTQVGDKYVTEELMARDLVLGGEQSGHIIFADHLYTGDGIATALNVLSVMAESGRELAALADELRTYPQILVNVKVKSRRELSSVPALLDAIAAAETRLAGRGRVLVRYSGTEPLLRIMVEGPSDEEVRSVTDHLADVARMHLG